MTTVTAVLFESKMAEDVDTLQYQSDAVTTIIDKLTAYNTGGSNLTLTVNLLAPSGSASTANRIITKTLAAGSTYTFPEVVGHVLAPGGGINTRASTANAIAIRASGRQVS